jgi:Na+-transporting methylmalonyl-CoA/oxaloacetate decarboxylase gamma subunit
MSSAITGGVALDGKAIITIIGDKSPTTDGPIDDELEEAHETKKVIEEQNMLLIIVIVILVVFILVLMFLLMRSKGKSKEEKEEKEPEEEEEAAAEEDEDWSSVDAEEAEPGTEEEPPAEEDLDDWKLDDEAPPSMDVEPTAELAEEELAAAPEIEDIPATKKPSKGALKKPGKGKKPGKDKGDAEDTKKSKKSKGKGKGKVIKPQETSTRPLGKPKLLNLDKIVKCHICFGNVKTGLNVVKCGCGKHYHENCANRVGTCPVCEANMKSAVDMTDKDDES